MLMKKQTQNPNCQSLHQIQSKQDTKLMSTIYYIPNITTKIKQQEIVLNYCFGFACANVASLRYIFNA